MRDLRRIRELIIQALVSNDALFLQIVLKGGNALELIHHVGNRSSLDLDFSLSPDFQDPDGAGEQIERALVTYLGGHGLRVLDFEFARKPESRTRDIPEWWGGYRAEFKLIEDGLYRQFGSELETIRRRSIPIGEGTQKRIFKIDFSRHEYCDDKVGKELDDLLVYAYSLDMIAAEKLRAICQQMPGYRHIPNNMKRARARDFYDIEAILRTGVNLTSPSNLKMIDRMFEVKDVPLGLLGRVQACESFHSDAWAEVSTSVSGQLEPFAFYFDRVSKVAREVLDALGKE